MSTRVSAVATSCRARRPSQPMASAPARENTVSPASVLTPIRLAPAAPANAPVGSASATKAEPRTTTKNPTTPATTATIVATSQVSVMKLLNIRLPAPVAPRPGQQEEGQDESHDKEAHRPAVPGRGPVEAVV